MTETEFEQGEFDPIEQDEPYSEAAGYVEMTEEQVKLFAAGMALTLQAQNLKDDHYESFELNAADTCLIGLGLMLLTAFVPTKLFFSEQALDLADRLAENVLDPVV